MGRLQVNASQTFKINSREKAWSELEFSEQIIIVPNGDWIELHSLIADWDRGGVGKGPIHTTGVLGSCSCRNSTTVCIAWNKGNLLFHQAGG